MSDPIIKRAVFDEATNTWTTDTDKVFRVGEVLTLDMSGPVGYSLNKLRDIYEELLLERGKLQQKLANSFMNYRVRHEKPPENYDDLNSELAYQSLRLAALTDNAGVYKSLAELDIYVELGYFVTLSMKFTLDGDGLVITVSPPRENELQHENIVSMSASVSEYVSEGAKFAATITNIRPIIRSVSSAKELEAAGYSASSDQVIDVANKIPGLYLPISLWPKLFGMFGWVYADLDMSKLPEILPDVFNNIVLKDQLAVYVLGSGSINSHRGAFIHVIPADAFASDDSIESNINKLSNVSGTLDLDSFAVFKAVPVDEAMIPVALVVSKDTTTTYSQSQINGMFDVDSDLSKSAFDLNMFASLTNRIVL